MCIYTQLENALEKQLENSLLQEIVDLKVSLLDVKTVLKNLHKEIRSRHHGRMPDEVKVAMDAAEAVLLELEEKQP